MCKMEGTITKEKDIIPNDTKVLMNRELFLIKGNDAQTSRKNENGEYIDLNYYLVRPGEPFDKEIMTWDKDFSVIL